MCGTCFKEKRVADAKEVALSIEQITTLTPRQARNRKIVISCLLIVGLVFLRAAWGAAHTRLGLIVGAGGGSEITPFDYAATSYSFIGQRMGWSEEGQKYRFLTFVYGILGLVCFALSAWRLLALRRMLKLKNDRPA
jgi:hypothetical protein